MKWRLFLTTTGLEPSKKSMFYGIHFLFFSHFKYMHTMIINRRWKITTFPSNNNPKNNETKKNRGGPGLFGGHHYHHSFSLRTFAKQQLSFCVCSCTHIIRKKKEKKLRNATPKTKNEIKSNYFNTQEKQMCVYAHIHCFFSCLVAWLHSFLFFFFFGYFICTHTQDTPYTYHKYKFVRNWRNRRKTTQ